jgi:arylsulfatase A-like enzyme
MNGKRRAVSVILAVVVGVAWRVSPTPAAEPVVARSSKVDRPNVLFFAVDDLRPEFGAYGKSYIHSPNLDRIAARGVTFRRAYCQQAVCSPSRSSLLTGTRPDTTRVYDLQTHFRKALPDVVALPQHFKQNGYYVQGMGKLYHGGLDDPRSWSTPWTSPKTTHGAYGLEENRAIVRAKVEASQAAAKKNGPPKPGQKVRNYGPPFESSEVPDNTFHDGALAEMAVEALGKLAKQDRPFWLGVGFIRPHLPFVAPKKYWDLYDPAKIELASNPFPPRGAPDYAVQSGGELRTYHGVPEGKIPDDYARQLKHGYYAAISYMDAQVGRVLDELDRQGLTEKTVIVLWGDHGWKLGEHGAWCKHTNVENDTNAPLLIAAPGYKSAGRGTESLAEFVDIYPTLVDLCGLPTPDHLEGTSLVPVLRDPAAKVKEAAFSQYPRAVAGKKLMGYTMRTDRYRFTRWIRTDSAASDAATGPTPVDAVELYDHQNDPQENTNIASAPENAELVERLTRQWLAGPPGKAMKN